MECAIIGSPLAGKTTLFHILTGQTSAAADTDKRETLRGVARLRDDRLQPLAKIWKSRKITEATVNYTDLPGLPSTVAKREPYPPRYLAELRPADMLALVVRAFDDPAAPHPAGSINPARDAENARLEFILNDLDVIDRRLERLAKQHDPKLAKEKELLELSRETLSAERSLNELTWTAEDLKILNAYAPLSLKPLLVVLNLDETLAREADSQIAALQEKTNFPSAAVHYVAVAAGIEAEISRLEESEREPFQSELGFTLPALDRVIKATFKLMGLISFLTTGEKETRAWPLRAGSTALEAADVVHEDIARGFIRAEVYQWEDIIKAGSFSKLRDEGKLRLEGRDYIVKEGDVLNVRFNI